MLGGRAVAHGQKPNDVDRQQSDVKKHHRRNMRGVSVRDKKNVAHDGDQTQGQHGRHQKRRQHGNRCGVAQNVGQGEAHAGCALQVPRHRGASLDLDPRALPGEIMKRLWRRTKLLEGSGRHFRQFIRQATIDQPPPHEFHFLCIDKSSFRPVSTRCRSRMVSPQVSLGDERSEIIGCTCSDQAAGGNRQAE